MPEKLNGYNQVLNHMGWGSFLVLGFTSQRNHSLRGSGIYGFGWVEDSGDGDSEQRLVLQAFGGCP